jgi:hypothetical protein
MRVTSISADVRNPISAGADAVAKADAVEMVVSHVTGGKAGAPESIEKAACAAKKARLLGMMDGIELMDAFDARFKALLHARAALRKTEDAGDAQLACTAGLLDDFAEMGALVNAQTAGVMDDAEHALPHGVGKLRRALRWAQCYDAVLEMANLAFDVLFVAVDLWSHFQLFVAATAILGLSLLARLWIGLAERRHVDWASKKWLYMRGLLLSMVEPFWGGRLIKRSFHASAKSGGQVFDAATDSWVDDDRDPLAVQAGNDLAATQAEMMTSLVLVLVEDMPGFAVQVLFLSRAETGFSLRDPVLLLTVATTLLHAWKQLAETWQLRRDLPRLKQQAEARHKVFDPETATDDALVAFATSAAGPHVRNVGLKKCKAITDAGVQALAAGCSGLTAIHLEDCSAITDAGAQALARGCPGLISIDLCRCSAITDAGAQALAKGCPGLTAIRLKGCSAITDAGAQALARGCPGLISIDLCRCSAMTDAGAQALARGCRGLISIRLEDCSAITDAGAQALARGCPGLISIRLKGCSAITDAGAQALAAGCPGLTTIHLQHCSKMTDAGVMALAKGCPGLTSIYLDGCSEMTDAGVQALAKGCPGLTSIHLNGCSAITDAGVQALAGGCPGIKF